MNRKDFLKTSATVGLGLPFLSSLLASCAEENLVRDLGDVNFSGRVLIIGAGSAGLTAGYALSKYDIDFDILEASSVFGGRVKKADNFADFPIDLGAEWLHTDPAILADLVNDPTVNADIELIVYNPQTYRIWKDGELKKRNLAKHFYSEYKFKNTTWYDFLEDFIVPGIADRIQYNSPVSSIDYSGDQIRVLTSDDRVFEADRVILTVPLTILKQGRIEFTPALPAQKLNALDQVDMPDGMKVFLEFSERFYPDIVFGGSLVEYLTDDDGDKIFYDAAFRKDSDRNILALFTVGAKATPYVGYPTEDALINALLSELDEMFDGKASRTYIQHVVQNWSKESFIGGSYSHYDNYDAHKILQLPIDDKLFFAGEAYAPEDHLATVHGAGLSGYNAVERILKG